MVASTSCEPAPTSARSTAGTRWRRALFIAVPAVAIVLLMAVSMLNGRLPVGVAMSRQNFSFSASAVRSDQPILVDSDGSTAPSTRNQGNRISTASAVLDGVCLVLKRHVPGTNLSFSVAVRIPGEGTTATDLSMDAGSIDVGAANLEATSAAPIVLGQSYDSSSQAPLSLGTGTSTTMRRLLVDSRSALLSTVLNPARGARFTLLGNGDGVCDI